MIIKENVPLKYILNIYKTNNPSIEDYLWMYIKYLDDKKIWSSVIKETQILKNVWNNNVDIQLIREQFKKANWIIVDDDKWTFNESMWTKKS